MKLSNEAMLESALLSRRAEQLARGNASQRAEANVLLSRIKLINDNGLSIEEMTQNYAELRGSQIEEELAGHKIRKPGALTIEESRALKPLFEQYLRSTPSVLSDSEYEQRATVLLGRPISQTYAGTDGGQFVPLDFSDNFFLGLAQVSPLLDENNVTLEKSGSYALPASVAAEWDLSQLAATKPGGTGAYGDATQQAPFSVPTTLSSLLDPTIYKVTLSAAIELVQDDPTLMSRIQKAYSIGFARGIGADLVNGSGNGFVPQGILTGAVDSGVTIGTGNYSSVGSQPAGNITAEDLLNVYFSLNRIYRNSPKCAWCMSDGVYQRIRNSSDNMGRPLIRVQDDEETLLGKKVLICPDIAGGAGDESPVVAGSIVFGDLNYYRVRLSQLSISKTMENTGAIEAGEIWFVGRQRCAAQVVDPTGGNGPSPIVKATVASSAFLI